MATDDFFFEISPHVVEDFGYSLYSDLSRVIVEFLANSYDADATYADVIMDESAVRSQRHAYLGQKSAVQAGKLDASEVIQTLPSNITIEIRDNGHGMTPAELQDNFLIAGRRRRGVDGTSNKSRGGRLLMGRKGLGKLAGFGVARVITIRTRADGEPVATEISLDFEQISKWTEGVRIPVEAKTLDDDGGIGQHGTRVFLSHLSPDAISSRLSTIEKKAVKHFRVVRETDFEVRVNGALASPEEIEYAWAWPEPGTDVGELVESEFRAEGETYKFSYRLRFVEDHRSLEASERGVRVYAHGRLAASASLLDADTNMHGFRMTDYLDGVVQADFIDEQSRDLIATDRQSLHWDSPILLPLKSFLSAQIKEACKERQKVRENVTRSLVKKDSHTRSVIESANLTGREVTAAYKIATALASANKQNLNSTSYKNRLTEVVSAMGRGELLSTLHELAEDPEPEMSSLVGAVTDLTKDQVDGFCKYARGRIDAILALQKIVNDTNFAHKNNEKELHVMLRDSPWLIDPSLFEFVASEKSQRNVYKELAKKLKVGDYTPEDYDEKSSEAIDPGAFNRRPDLVFLLGDSGGHELVIVELKAPNTPLHSGHLDQLKDYMRIAEEWLESNDKKIQVRGYLIGTMPTTGSSTTLANRLHYELAHAGPATMWKVRSLSRVLDDTFNAHKSLLDSWDVDDSSNE